MALSLSLSSSHPNVLFDSLLKRISRFLNNPHNDFHSLFNSLIKHILSSYHIKHPDNRIFLSFDHMFVRNKFTIFMISLRIGKQGFPIFFNVFPGQGQPGFGEAFKMDMIQSSLFYVHQLFKSINPDIHIVFLADRWFGNFFPLFRFIDQELHDSFVFRCKDNFKVFYFDKKENHHIWTDIHHLPSYTYHSSFFHDLPFTKNKFTYNLTICKSDGHSERWFLISNVDPTRARGFYRYRFGGIETIFKNQKTNGFYLEKTGVKNLHAFDNLYSLLCGAVAYLMCLGTHVSKNIRSYQSLGFKCVRKKKDGSLFRLVSLFQTGVRLFLIAFNSPRYYYLPFLFKLHDI